MDIFTTFATDAKLEVEGRWCQLSSDAKVLVARAGNPNFVDLMRKTLKRHAVNLDIKTKENNELVERLVQEVMADTILLDWEGLSFKGEPLKYSRENARKLLAIKDFRTKINELAEEGSAFLISEVTEQGED